MGRLTDRVAKAAKKPDNGQVLIRDGDVRGFALRVTSNGCKTWVWDGRVRGQMRRITIGRYPDLTAREASAEALLIRHEIAVGHDPADKRQREREELTVAKLADLYLELHAKQHKRSWRQDEHRIHLHLRALASLKLSACNRAAVVRWHDRIADQRGRFQANRCLALLSAIFGWANRQSHWVGENPAKGVQRFHEPKRDRFLNAEELSRLWKVLEAEPSWHWRAYFKLALLLGMRKTELLRARWENINLVEATWLLPKTKNNRAHLLPIPSPAMEILEVLPSKEQSEWLFPSNGRSGEPFSRPDDAWESIRVKANLSQVRIHDLRRTNASWLAAQGCSLPLIGRVLNHTQPSTTAIYARLDLAPIRQALERNAKLMLGERQTTTGSNDHRSV